MACYGVDFNNEQEYIGMDNPYKIWMPDLIKDSRTGN
jgi:hypothetical protein